MPDVDTGTAELDRLLTRVEDFKIRFGDLAQLAPETLVVSWPTLRGLSVCYCRGVTAGFGIGLVHMYLRWLCQSTGPRKRHRL